MYTDKKKPEFSFKTICNGHRYFISVVLLDNAGMYEVFKSILSSNLVERRLEFGDYTNVDGTVEKITGFFDYIEKDKTIIIKFDAKEFNMGTIEEMYEDGSSILAEAYNQLQVLKKQTTIIEKHLK